MLIKKSEKRKKEVPNCIVDEYDFPTKELSLAIAEINGRYPETGKNKNTHCEQIEYVLSGKGVIHSDQGDFEIQEGDSYYFQKNEVYYLEGDNLIIAIANSPKWTPEQYEHLD